MTNEISIQGREDATDAQRREQLLDRLARRIAESGMTAPAILFLESSKPLAFFGAQLMWLVQPLLAFNSIVWSDVADLMQDPAGIDALIKRLEPGNAR
jgi:hypothetical protein